MILQWNPCNKHDFVKTVSGKWWNLCVFSKTFTVSLYRFNVFEIPSTIVLRICSGAGVLIWYDCMVCCCGFCYWVPAMNYPLDIYKMCIISDWIQNFFNLISCDLRRGWCPKDMCLADSHLFTYIILQYYHKMLIIGTLFTITLSCNNWSGAR